MNLLTIILLILFAYAGFILLIARKLQQDDKFVLRVFLNTIYWIVVFVLPIIISPVGVYYLIKGGKIYILFYFLVATAFFILFRRCVASLTARSKK